MKYTPYVQECLKALENGREYESDITLMYLIRIQRLTERIFEFTSKDRAEEDIPGIPPAPTSAYIAAFQKEIDTMRDSLPARLQNDSMWNIPSAVELRFST